MGTLAISAANLSTLENNMNVLNSNINSVSQDVVNINGRIDTVDTNVENMQKSITSLEDEIRSFMREIKGNSLVANAQNDILIKQNTLSSKYGYYDSVRRQAIGLVQNIDKGKISKRTILSLKDKIIINTPNYYLSYAYHYVTEMLYTERRGKRQNLVHHALFYMDDIILLGSNKKHMRINTRYLLYKVS